MTTLTPQRLTDEVVRLDDPAFYIDDPFPIYARMRAEQPVYWYEPLRLWAVTRYEDINRISRNPMIFSSEQGLVINDLKYDQSMVKSLFPPGAEHLMASDPPRHRVLRRMLGVSFGAKGVAALEHRVREIAISMLDSLPVGEELEFVSQVAAVFPMAVLCAFMGISADRVVDLARWADATTAVGEPRSREQFEELLIELGRCYQFFGGEVAARSACPRGDVISSLLTAELDGEPLNEMTLLMFCQFLTAAAGETTRHLLTGALIALAEHPDQYARLRADPSTLAEPASEEFLRWVTPAIGFVRTALTDTMLSGQRILAGERVLMLYPAGNRDPAIWPDADRFDIGRPLAQPHLAFGVGEHLCLGAALARLEIRVFWEEFVRRFGSIELRAEPRRQRTTLFTAWEELRVALHE